ncbi:DUF500 domain-containing protein [Paracoccidioides lutzii Pb01]|uniref:DUF500 domain-containing protein n=1 Tax=Paracoccidioides lutzii (strain ATCC MYA-826 / Pb01) TaxID=502779 RepID=C1H1T2_PARBA|nr:DUF500 domain-containing protein [Paracoccidioides lutzii Pb01]EEH33819.1 DUF500 domain-containing protein [Paracoccidioides lutzii Pb01]
MPHSKWEKAKLYSKRGFDKVWNTVDKLGAPGNRSSKKLGAEAFWPATLDKESDKAARILRSFCKDGFYTEVEDENERQSGSSSHASKDDRTAEYKGTEGRNRGIIGKPRGKQRVVQKIPSAVIKQAKGLAIFTTMRTGLWPSGSGGSGILVARIKETGEWSPPSGIMLHTAGLGFLTGVDIYDCVVIINTCEALERFKGIRCTLGGEVSVVAGPVGVGGVLETEMHKRQAPLWMYLKSRGFYVGGQVDGATIIERSDENERFYGERISAAGILAGKAKHPPQSITTLMQTIKAAQGDTDVDNSMLPPPGEAPGDAEIEKDLFGIPAPKDPDPFGVKALEQEGIVIREAGTRRIPSSGMFEFRPSPTSPIFDHRFPRLSASSSQRDSWRSSVQSTASADRSTQTDDFIDSRPTVSLTSISRISSHNGKDRTPWSLYQLEVDNSSITESTTASTKENSSPRRGSLCIQDHTIPEDPNQARPASPSFTRARLVTIHKRLSPPPPPLPARNATRVTSPTLLHLPISEEATQDQISAYDESIEIFEVHDGDENHGLMKHDSTVKDVFKGEVAFEEIQSAKADKSSNENRYQRGGRLYKGTTGEEGYGEVLTTMGEKEDVAHGKLQKDNHPKKRETLTEKFKSMDKAEVVLSLDETLQNGFVNEDKEEFHSVPISLKSTIRLQ